MKEESYYNESSMDNMEHGFYNDEDQNMHYLMDNPMMYQNNIDGQNQFRFQDNDGYY